MLGAPMGQSRWWEMQSFAWTPGQAQSLIFQINSLPPNHKVKALMLAFDCDVTTAGADGILPYDLMGLLVTLVQHSSPFFQLRASGYVLGNLFHAMNGKTLQNTLFGDGAATDGPNRALLVIPLADKYSLEPSDSSIPTELLNNTQIQVITSAATAAGLLGANGVMTGVFRLYAALEKGSGAIDPTATRIDYEDWGGQTVNLKPGAYSHILLMNDATGITAAGAAAPITTDAQITRLNLTVGGYQVVNNALSWSNVALFNASVPQGGFENNAAEQLNDVSVPFIPLYTPPNGYSYVELPGSPTPEVQAQFSGTQTTVRVAYRSAMFKDSSPIRAAAAAFDVRGPYARKLKTFSKKDINGGSNAPRDIERRSYASQLLPGRLVR